MKTNFPPCDFELVKIFEFEMTQRCQQIQKFWLRLSSANQADWTYQVSNLYDTETIRYQTYQIMNLSKLWTNLIPNLSDFEPMYLIPNPYESNISDFDPIWSQTYLIPNLSDTEPFWYYQTGPEAFLWPTPLFGPCPSPFVPKMTATPYLARLVAKLAMKQVNTTSSPLSYSSSRCPPTVLACSMEKLGTKPDNSSPLSP